MIAAFPTISMDPLSVAAQDRNDHRTTQGQWYYDSVHKDDHAWNDDEGGRITPTSMSTT